MIDDFQLMGQETMMIIDRVCVQALKESEETVTANVESDPLESARLAETRGIAGEQGQFGVAIVTGNH